MEDYVEMSKEILNDSKLSLKAKGLLCMLLANIEEGCGCSFTEILAMCKERASAYLKVVKELVKHNYLLVSEKYYFDLDRMSKPEKNLIYTINLDKLNINKEED